MDTSGESPKVEVAFVVSIEVLENSSYLLVGGSDLEGVQLVLEVCVRDKSITVFVKLSEHLEDLHWALENLLF